MGADYVRFTLHYWRSHSLQVARRAGIMQYLVEVHTNRRAARRAGAAGNRPGGVP